MKRNLLIFLFLIFFMGCGPYIWFKSPQPEGRRNLESFPNELIGKYISLSDSSAIIINANRIIKQFHEELLMSKIEFKEETGDIPLKDTSFLFTDNWHIKVKLFGDSVKVFSWKDEVQFEISDNQLLRKYRGIYFLNTKDTNDLWKVQLLHLTKDTLEFDDILMVGDMAKIKDITKVDEVKDTAKERKSRYYLNPSRRELRKILKARNPGNKYYKHYL
ncbi:MAG: hypothetical protein ACQERU_03315 [Bacteroidota bacterium]